jgi:mannose-1-phosphate guanylyltransferase
MNAKLKYADDGVSLQPAVRRSGLATGNENAWAVVLAAGEGSRLRALTMTPSGVHVPKQFCSLLSGPSLLHQAISRARSIAPNERICTIVAAQHHRWWASLPASNLIVQPENRGTANGVMLALLHIQERDPCAQIVLLPADHHVQDEPTLAESLRCALMHLRMRPHETLLLGIEAEEPDPELGYIVPGDRSRDGTFEVLQFVEKPSAERARELIDNGALWNAFIVAASVRALLHVLAGRFPEIVSEMRAAVRKDLLCPPNATATAELYERLPHLDFSRDVLGNGQDANLRVLPTPQCGWSDLGTSKRVDKTLRQVRSRPRSMEASVSVNTYISLAERLEGLRGATQGS